jgi:DNA-binding transcriptional MerR regulator
MVIDTLKMAKRLRDAGFSEPQAEAMVASVREAAQSADLATKRDLEAAIAALRSELREAELRLEAKIEALKADILSRVFALILGALVVNIIAIVGAMFGVAKLLGH